MLICSYSLLQNFTKNDGTQADFWVNGMTIFGASIFVANVKVMLFSTCFTITQTVIIFGSILLYIISGAIIDKISSSNFYNSYEEMHLIPNLYFLYILIFVVCSCVDFGISQYVNMQNKYEHGENYMVSKTLQAALSGFKPKKRRTGFAYSQEDLGYQDSFQKGYRM